MEPAQSSKERATFAQIISNIKMIVLGVKGGACWAYQNRLAFRVIPRLFRFFKSLASCHSHHSYILY
jgi:hypothetical protein